MLNYDEDEWNVLRHADDKLHHQNRREEHDGFIGTANFSAKQYKIASIWLGSAPSVRWMVRWMIWYKIFTVAEDSYY